MHKSDPRARSGAPGRKYSAYFDRMLGFAGAGAVGTVCHYLVLVAGASLLHHDPVRASVAGALLGALVNYLLNYHLNYRSQRSHRQTGPRFFIVAGVGFALNWLFMEQLVHVLDFPYLLSQITVTGLVFFWNFTANHFWTFRPGGRSGPP